MSDPLDGFHPLLREWFGTAHGTPTDIQARAWPRIAAGEHLLISAPTGSGKTLTAFLWAINRFVRGDLPTGRLRILYVSPLKALNNDIYRNLRRPLAELERWFERAGEPFPQIRVMTRSGDTPQSERRQMIRKPPDILITTPESLNLLLSSKGGVGILGDLNTVILDEIHAIIGGKRGVHLMTAVERLTLLSGEFQRLALSATVNPMDVVARYVGGLRRDGEGSGGGYRPRPVSRVHSTAAKAYDFRVVFPSSARDLPPDDDVWTPLSAEFRRIIERNRSTLLFTNNRQLTETLTFRINGDGEEPLAYAHHGSLSRPIREAVERRLKAGELRAIVATSSLEMGIDIGALDAVVLIQSPGSISSTIQRLGRAGHQVGAVSRGVLYATHSRDLLAGAVLAGAVRDGDIEPVRPIDNALDVLAQVLVSMTGMDTWNVDELYGVIRCAYPYRDLPRELFDTVLEMLAGRYAGTRIRELHPRVSLDRIAGTVRARRGALQSVYRGGGTIPDRGYFHLRHSQSGSRIGELDEEFVWENGPGAQFTLGNQRWRVERVTHNDVFVRPGDPGKPAPPFWKAEGMNREPHFANRIGAFLEAAEARRDDPGFGRELEALGIDGESVAALLDLLDRQREATGTALPHRHHVVLEWIDSGPGGAPGRQLFIHTTWGGRLNRPLGLALQAAWQEHCNAPVEVFPGDDGVVIVLPEEELSAETILAMVRPDTVLPLLQRSLEGSGFFGARFRECAGRALLVTREKAGRRMPLWMSRLRSQKLFGAVRELEDFPILLETWRTCLEDEFDLAGLTERLEGLAAGTIAWSEARTAAGSPFARSLTWRQINQYMYMDDRPMEGGATRLRGDLLQTILFEPELRPAIPAPVVAAFIAKRQRLADGYAPRGAREVLDWVVERLALPQPEWTALLDAVQRDHGIAREEIESALAQRIVRLQPRGAHNPLIVAREMEATLAALLEPSRNGGGEGPDPADLLGQWLSYHGPLTIESIAETLGLALTDLTPLLDDLVDDRRVVTGRLVEGEEADRLCDAENMEILLRLKRAAAAPVFEPLPLDDLPLFLAGTMDILDPGSDGPALGERLAKLAGYPAEAALWEGEFLPARMHRYDLSWLDHLLARGDLVWLGAGRRQITFALTDDLDILRDPPGDNDIEDDADDTPADADPETGTAAGETGDDASSDPDAVNRLASLFETEYARYDFTALLRLTNLDSPTLVRALWSAVWTGRIANDSAVALRKGIDNRWSVPGKEAERPAMAHGRRRRGTGRGRFQRWKGATPFAGTWFRLPEPLPAEDPVEEAERDKERARLLLDRYGIVFRELLARELPPLRWPKVFRALRMMELSGEVVAGYFFRDIPGPQFIDPDGFRRLSRPLPADAVWMINALDPASLCGVQIPALRGRLPRRVPSTHLIYRGSELVVISERQGKRVTIESEADAPFLPEALGLLGRLLVRPHLARGRLVVETINGLPAPASPYRPILMALFDVVDDYRHLSLYPRKTS